MSYAQNLNQQQKEAVEHVEGPLLVVAGAGSGKTRVVTCRVARLLERGILPSDILAVTFTNKAADVMKKRIRDLQGKEILTCTFHSLGARILRESIGALGYTSQFTIYDEDDSENLLKSCLDQFPHREEKGFLKQARLFISSAKNDLLEPSDTMSVALHEKVFSDLYTLYQNKLREANAVDFDDLLFLTVKLLRDHEKVRTEYQNRWLFILIDEYQDTNMAQYTLAKLLVAKHGNIFAVGDPDQSIYSWRGARYQNILHFSSDFPGAKIITLEQNYRSTSTILQAANAVIAHNSERYEKNLWSTLEKGDKIGVYFALSERKEAEFVLEKLAKHHLDERISLEEIAIFYRTNAQSRVFEDLLLARRIPYEIIGGLSFYQRREIKDLLAFARIALSGADFLSFSRTIYIPRRGLGATTVKKIVESAQEKRMSLLSFCEEGVHSSDVKLSQRQKEALKEYLDLIQRLRNALASESKVSHFLSEVVRITGYINHLKEDPESFEDRKENIEALISKAAEWEEETDNPSLSSFLEELSLKAHRDQKEGSAIKLMTLHHGKGLEFELVFIVGLEEGLLPHNNAKDSFQNLEEERRLFYVGMTRAKRQLYLLAAYNRMIWGAPRPMQPSRFFKEVPSEFLHNFSAAEIYKQEDVSSEDSLFSVGERVIHREFGVGIIQKTYHTSYGTTYDVFFEESSTTRSLIAKYAKLQPARF